MKWFCMGMIVFFIVTGCAQQSQEKLQPAAPHSIAAKGNDDLQRMDTAKRLVRQDQRVDEATAVIVDHELSVGLKVSNFNRFFLKRIRKENHDRLKKQFPKPYQIQVTTDNKLFAELKKMESEQRKNPSYRTKAAQQKLKKINEDMKG
ncbi:YhcN/YlaJ family sporulation lipoprotein [Desmospora activa]|uniref:YhcN/YlaJ family sporulation lipoprotein n=1 Tax=Desmospora activa TaxID=500615 RepID=UPI0011B20718|nr:YhcN/YlaJ family sporulation lipoprotein [Desmospora activa]